MQIASRVVARRSPALGWTDTAAKPKRSFIVALSALDWPNMDGPEVDQQTALAAQSAAATTCVGELGSPPKVDVTVHAIPNSHYFECRRAPDGSVLEGITTSREHVFAVLITDTVALSKRTLEAVSGYRDRIRRCSGEAEEPRTPSRPNAPSGVLPHYEPPGQSQNDLVFRFRHLPTRHRSTGMPCPRHQSG
jgi:hypothetical protein